MQFTAIPPADAIISRVPGSTNFPQGTGLEKFRISDLITWAMEGKLVGYVNNRGGEDGFAKVDPAMVKEIAENLDTKALGTFLIGINNNEMMLGDSHNRTQGLLIRWWEGKLSAAEMTTEIAIRLVPLYPFADFVKMYIKVNNAARHNSRGRISNPDLAYGNILSAVCAKLTGDAKTQFLKKEGYLAMFSYIVWAMTKENIDWQFPDVYKLRGDATQSQNTPAGTIKLTDDQIELVADCIEQYADLLTQASETKCPHKALNSAGMFGLYVVDRLAEKQQLPKNKVLVGRIQKKYDSVTAAVFHSHAWWLRRST